MRHDLKVPFAEKDQAKKLGARWDPARKLWYVDDKLDLALFARWQPVPHDGAAPATAPPRSAATSRARTAGSALQRGSRFVEQSLSCACLPWEDCERCRQ